MQYLITFLEGIISFVSPCMLPMLPVYVLYFSGNQQNRTHTLANAGMFVLGFTLVFSAMGLFAGTLGSFLTAYQNLVNLICGAVIILLGLSYLGVFQLSFLKGYSGAVNITGIFSAFVFGLIYAVSLTPCIGVFLGSALMLASVSASAGKGLLLLVLYSVGLGIPFMISALLIEQMGNLFAVIKENYEKINKICGIFLILVGILTAAGLFSRVMAMF